MLANRRQLSVWRSNHTKIEENNRRNLTSGRTSQGPDKVLKRHLMTSMSVIEALLIQEALIKSRQKSIYAQ